MQDRNWKIILYQKIPEMQEIFKQRTFWMDDAPCTKVRFVKISSYFKIGMYFDMILTLTQ